MLHKNLVHPRSIVIVGGSDNIHSPGGRVLKNLIDHNYKGKLFVVNPKKREVQNVTSYHHINEIPDVDLAIIAIAAKNVIETVKVLTECKNTRGFIIFSAGFSEKDQDGAKLEREIVSLINHVGGSLLGPNNIGLINEYFTGVFTTPIPKLNKNGVDLISGSGATAVFIIEAAQSMGLPFSSIYTVGNSAQNGIEEILEFFDRSFHKNISSKVKLLYIENIKNPIKFLKHSSSLIKKGCHIAAIKSGNSEAGHRAASSHTGALANSDVFIDALFKKAGIIRCHGRNDLITTAGILMQKEAKGKNIAIITHAGGPAVMLTDVLSKNGLTVPKLEGKLTIDLLSKLHNGSSIANPIDFLATGTAEQLEVIIDYCDNKFDNIDALAVIFGSPGLTSVHEAYEVLFNKIKTCSKPIYAILPSVINAKDEMTNIIAKGSIVFTDEVLFGNALSKVYNTQKPDQNNNISEPLDKNIIRKHIDCVPHGYLSSENTIKLLKCAGINFVDQYEAKNEYELLQIAKSLNYPVAQKVLGPIHKSDVGGVVLHIKNEEELLLNFNKLMQIKKATSVIIQPMKKGIELFIGAKKEGNYPHIVMCGLGGVFVEVLKDISTNMVPVAIEESLQMITRLKSYPILKGFRGQKGINLDKFADTISKVSSLLEIVPEIVELDINPIMATKNELIAVDARIRVESEK